ncbi:Uncharacterised protein [Mycobacteroides abscessus subsp. abscessus]|uniref:Transposase n=1 Tax=Mycobacteroides abscessus subsp. abscessus TaxID=1185650 RepID=A0AB38D7V4_9MYCO|nr:Uncharacterised protein [Mycobacteroides abscessus subsp. abscessus]SIC12420.1 Uncharacterised protein [Mycobacteroides abscessus subsp. abscessus]SIC22634.1 Uncharacterised protein [Mycobacteroides abscessus subsp. abscessus]SIC25478.1 Uncharacterised protein [Mycobacteroides abscessus subsp. abscessus]SIF77641.1 Uncharacterised protein [Mycobacteroides abscessus subsp. abscessus]
MSDSEAPLTPIERLVITALYLRLTSKDVLRPRQHPNGGMNQQVRQSHISVSHSLSHNPSHGGAE